jgi:hypothetical protein
MKALILASLINGSGRLLIAATAGVLLVACASDPPAPTAALDSARLAITQAERAEAGRYAGGELAEARTRLAMADTAVTQKQMVPAERFANESRTDAELASATTAKAKAQAVNADMQRSNGSLIEEIQRNDGVAP